MSNPAHRSIASHFSQVKDPRYHHSPPHRLMDIITLALCAVICGANNWEAIAAFGRAKEGWLRTFLPLPHGIPSADTFERVFAQLDPQQFQAAFISWVQAISQLTEGEVVAIDGKTARGSRDEGQGKAAIHMVSAWASQNSLVLGQVKVADKSNEITAIPALLRVLVLRGCIITLDGWAVRPRLPL